MKAICIIGIDEVGRGPLAGPVYVCAAMMKANVYEKQDFSGLTDSKKMTARAREEWFKKAKEMEKEGKLQFAIGKASAKEIDAIGISNAIHKSINQALKKLNPDPRVTRIELDGGLKAPAEFSDQETFTKGDLKRPIISLASVIAKVSRDRYMTTLSKKYPQFCWHGNKGYGTAAHRSAISAKTLTIYHRKSFLTRILDPEVRLGIATKLPPSH
jgi:ribonuclease HII